jgi:hypothetical protein
VYDLRMIGRIVECHVSVVEILLQPMKACVFYETKGGFLRDKESKDETRRSTPALPKASLSVAISATSIPLLALAFMLYVLVEY